MHQWQAINSLWLTNMHEFLLSLIAVDKCLGCFQFLWTTSFAHSLNKYSPLLNRSGKYVRKVNKLILKSICLCLFHHISPSSFQWSHRCFHLGILYSDYVCILGSIRQGSQERRNSKPASLVLQVIHTVKELSWRNIAFCICLKVCVYFVVVSC